VRRTALLLSRHDDRELNQLLARGRLSGAEYDDIEQRVLARAVPKRRRSLWPVVGPAAALAAAFGMSLLPRSPAETAVGRESGFRSKGDASRRDGVVSVGCGREMPLLCRLGDTLMFSVGARTRDGYLVAYAEREGDPEVQKIWYFPHAGGTTPRVPAGTNTRVLPEGVRLGTPHVRGRYRITARISDGPLSRSQLEGLGNDDAQVIAFDIE
jgi:hypothetical protein